MIIPAASGSRLPWLPLRMPPEAWLGLAATLLTALLLRHGWSSFDDGVYVWGARRLLDGAVLHDDLQGNHPGYSLYVDAWLFSVFGNNFSVLRYPLPLIAGILTAVIAWWLRPMGRTVQYVAAFGAASLGVVQFITPSSGWYAVALAAMTLAVFVKAVAAPGTASIKWLVLAGILVGICAGFRQLNGATLGAGLVILHAWLCRPGMEGSLAPARTLQAISLLAILVALGLMVIPALSAPSFMAWVYSFPALWCAGHALLSWRRNMQARDPRWLLPVTVGCVLGFLPAVAVALAQGALPGFVTDTVTDASTFADYSTLRDVKFDLAFVDAIELFAYGSAFASAGGSYLVIVGLMPVVLSLMLCMNRSALPDKTAAVVIYAAISLPMNITFQGLIYASYWLPAAMATLLALAAGISVGARKAALVFVAFLAMFALIFLSGRIPGSNLFKVLSEPWHRLVACTLPHCDLRVDPQLLDNLTRSYEDIRKHVPADRPLMLLPDGASLYGSLPHPSPWSTSFVIKGLFSGKQLAKLKREFLGQPNAILALDRQYLSSRERATELDSFIQSLCLEKKSARYLFLKACPISPTPEKGRNARPR